MNESGFERIFRSRRVAADMTITVNGSRYDVTGIPHAVPGNVLTVDLAQCTGRYIAVVINDSKELTEFMTATRVEYDAAGFRLDGKLYGSSEK